MNRGVDQQILSETTIAKLAEMEKTRNDLEQHYGDVLNEALGASSKEEELSILREGIRTVDTHHQHLRDTTNVQSQVSFPSYYGEDGINRWISKLRKEIESGKRRQLQTKLFCSILDEYIRGTEKDATVEVPDRDIQMTDFEAIPSEASEISITEQLNKMFTPSTAPIDLSVADKIFTATEYSTIRYGVNIFQEGIRSGTIKVSKGEAKAAIMNIVKKGLVFDSKVIEGLLASANNDVTISELANLMSIRLKDFGSWDWGTEDKTPVLRFQKFSNGKYRAFLEADFMNLLFLQIVGTKWSVQLRSLLDSVVCTKLFGQDYNTVAEYRGERNFLSSLPTTLEEEKVDTYQTTEKEEDAVNETPVMDGVQDRLDSLHKLSKWIARHRLSRPTEGLIVGFFDVEDFSNSIPHKVIIGILERFGVEKDWIAFFARYLTPQVSVRGKSTRGKIQRGTPLRYALSFLFGELVMLFADLAVDTKNNFSTNELSIGYSRTMDDCYLWSTDPKLMAEAYSAFKNVLACFGMKVNEEKSGHCDINFKLDNHPTITTFANRSESFKKLNGGLKSKIIDPKSIKSLPKGEVKWGFLKLDPNDGAWIVDKEMVAKFKETMVRKVKAGSSLMNQVNIYNSQLNFFTLYIGEFINCMGKEYLTSVLEALNEFHGNFCDGMTALQYFAGEIKNRFLKNDDYNVPEAWLYWPVTAGGLGLKHALVENFAYYDNDSNFGLYWSPHSISYSIPNNWDPYTCTELSALAVKKKTGSTNALITWDASEELERIFTWLRRGKGITVSVDGTPSGEPPHSEEFSKLVRMFCRRGTEMRGRRQTNLSLYWKWIVFNYSEQILDAFGSLEFASAGSVPLHLILSIKKESH
eukprot:TRINITY_DN5419_c0_g1_i4.p1 TRINITY_DN5419_c0_g1~~TRINITY_DN5419_c0_g1_i4.p1  ORF type:complete len:865 (+),score=266.24 TRINITY_DN5419_c0_g1_i4:186-2780(+)